MKQRLRMNRKFIAAIAGFAWFLVASTVADAATIKVWTARALATVLEKVGPEFERTSGHKLIVTSDLSPAFARRVASGETFDVMISASAPIQEFIDKGWIDANSRKTLARSGIGVEVRAGAPKPDISSVKAFQRALLEAKSIAYLQVGSGLYVGNLLERLGIAAAVAPKVTRPENDSVSELVAAGKVEIGIVVITQIMTTPGVELVGPLPQDIQSYITFVAGIGTSSKVPQPAEQLLKYLHSPSTIHVIEAQGMQAAR